MSNKEYPIVDGVPALEQALKRVRAAQEIYSAYTQEQVDKIFLAGRQNLPRGGYSR